jgi:cyclopropane fatty-acyl-phospholipid synthase-like methyltransferase
MIAMYRCLRRITFNIAYLFQPRWDGGIPAPELVRFIAKKTPGNAIDIGCGTGTNVLYLAQHDWQVTGVDFAPRAIARAKRKTRDYRTTLLVADVTKLAGLELPGLYDLGLDMGCFHSLSGSGRLAYAKGMEKWIKAQGVLMIYAFQPSKASAARGITREEMTSFFREGFELIQYEQGQGRPSAWYYFRRR